MRLEQRTLSLRKVERSCSSLRQRLTRADHYGVNRKICLQPARGKERVEPTDILVANGFNARQAQLVHQAAAADHVSAPGARVMLNEVSGRC